MTITAQTSKTGPYSGNGSTVDFDYTFYVHDLDDLVVVLLDADSVQTVLTLNTDYTATGAGSQGGGTVSLAVAPEIGEQLIIARSVDLTQEVDLQNRGAVSPEVLEAALDKLTQIAQDQQEQLNRAVLQDRFDPTSTEDFISNVSILAAVVDDVSTVAENVIDVTNFALVYLGAKASAPTTRNDSSALAAGDLYFNTTIGLMYVYSGSAWIASATNPTLVSVGDLADVDLTDVANGDILAYNLAADAFLATSSPLFSTMQLSGGTGDQGTFSWNADEATADLIQNGSTLQLGQEVQWNCRNNTGVSIADATPVMATGSLGASGRITIGPMSSTNQASAKYFMGVTTETIANGADGKVTHFGKVRGVDTSAWNDGDVLYLNPDLDGTFVTTAPTSGMSMAVAFVVYSHAVNGVLAVRATVLDENLFVKVSDIGTTVQAYSPILAATTASFTTALESKLSGIEAGADVTDATNVGAALGVSGASAGEMLSWTGSAFDWVTGAGLGTVTSVGLSAPTGFTVTGSPITASGTLTIGFDTGYQGYTSAEASKLLGIEYGADVTDATNVAAAGAVMTSAIGSTVQAHSAVLDATTASYTTALDTKLGGIEAGADVTATALGTAGAGTGEVLSWTGAAFDWIAVGGAGTVTSVGMTVPTGLEVSGSPITTSGTLAVTYTAGYQGYTSAEASKLAGVEAGATADQTAAEILTAVKTVDGSGSGLDADLLDGNHASAFATAAQGGLADTAVQPTDTQTQATWEAGTSTTESLVSPAKVSAAIKARPLASSGTKTSSYTLAVSDIGSFVTVGAGGAITVPNSTFSAGDLVSLFNNTTGDVTITVNTTAGYIAGTDTSITSATLATRGLANVFFIDATTCVLTGNVS